MASLRHCSAVMKVLCLHLRRPLEWRLLLGNCFLPWAESVITVWSAQVLVIEYSTIENLVSTIVLVVASHLMLVIVTSRSVPSVTVSHPANYLVPNFSVALPG